jgi:hypothetical protein
MVEGNTLAVYVTPATSNGMSAAPPVGEGSGPPPNQAGLDEAASDPEEGEGPNPEGAPLARRVFLGRKGEMGSIPHPPEVKKRPDSHAERQLRARWDAALKLFSTGGVGDLLCENVAKDLGLDSKHPRVQGFACNKIYRAAGMSRVDGARLALEDLARFEGSDPSLSLFRKQPDGSFLLAGTRLGAVQQAATNKGEGEKISYAMISRLPMAAAFLKIDLGLPVGAETHFFVNPALIPKMPVLNKAKGSNARHPLPPLVLLCLEAAANFDPALFTTNSPGSPGAWPEEGYDGVACDGPCPKHTLLAHRRIEVEVAQRLRACSNIPMVIDLARSVLVALVWAAGRGADGSAMQVTEIAVRSRPTSTWCPAVPPEAAAPPLGGSGNKGGGLPILGLKVEMNKKGVLDTPVWVPILSILGPQPPTWVEEWANPRLGRKYIIPEVEPPPADRKRKAPITEPEGEAWVARTQLARSPGYAEPWKHMKVSALRKVATTLIAVVTGIKEDDLSTAKLTGSHAGRHTMAEIVARLIWKAGTVDANALGDWSLPPPLSELDAPPARPRRAATPASVVPGAIPGARRPAPSAATKYQAVFNEEEQLRTRTRAMGATRTACALYVAEGGDITLETMWFDIIPAPRDAPPE